MLMPLSARVFRSTADKCVSVTTMNLLGFSKTHKTLPAEFHTHFNYNHMGGNLDHLLIKAGS